MTLTAPYRFDLSYARCFAVPQMAMDKRHIFMLHGVLCGHPFKSALEIGSFNGASATAFVEAINKGVGLGESGVATFCDVQPTHSLMSVVGNCLYPNRVRITGQPSWDVLDSADDFDFVFVDANHDLASVTEELKRLVVRRPLCVMAHDTNARDAGFPGCEGSQLLKHTFGIMPGYYCIEDRKQREGELTDRGLFLATRDAGLYEVAKQVFADLS
jgi:hypothetical protein